MRAVIGLAAALAVATAASPVEASMVLAKKARCVACHAVDQKRVGPSFRDIGAKYRGQDGIEARLMEKVRAGGSGNWGDVPMMPNPPERIADADLQSVVRWILDGAQTD
jgi:cytochrome c